MAWQPNDVKPSPNYTAGRITAGRIEQVSRIVVHDTEGSFDGTTSWFLSPASQVSAHYCIRKDGYVRQFVKLADTAWHCGFPPGTEHLYTGLWGVVSTNGISIGIELEGYSGQPYTDAQYASLIACCRYLRATYPAILLDRLHIVAHSDLNTGKRDPGKAFDWQRLMDGL